MKNQLNRRDFIKTVAATGVGLVIGDDLLAALNHDVHPGPSRFGVAGIPMEKVRIAYVGVGGMGTAHVENLLKIEGAEIVAICDIVESRVKRAQDMVEKAGFKRPDGYSKNEFDWQHVCERPDIDLVYSATPWQWHVPVSLAAMRSGKHAVTEVPASLTL